MWNKKQFEQELFFRLNRFKQPIKKVHQHHEN